MSEKRPIFSWYGEIHKIETRADGSARIQVDVHSDGLIPVQMIQRMQIQGDVSFAFAMVPYYAGEERPKASFEIAEDTTAPQAWPPKVED